MANITFEKKGMFVRYLGHTPVFWFSYNSNEMESDLHGSLHYKVFRETHVKKRRKSLSFYIYIIGWVSLCKPETQQNPVLIEDTSF